MIASALLALALAQAPAGAALPLASQRADAAGRGPALAVSSTSFTAGGPIPLQHSGYGRNLSPSLQWTAGPKGVRGYVVIVQDADAEGGPGRPLLHWLAYDIPADVTLLPAKLRNLPRTQEPVELNQGVNDHGGVGWTGPHPPVGAPAHHYHFQVFAVDRRLGVRPGAGLDEVQRAMGGHVLAQGEVVGLYAQPDEEAQRRERQRKQAEKDKAWAAKQSPEPASPPR